MKFQYASDLHLEFKENRDWLSQNPIKPVAPYLILAGDIFILNKMNKESDAFLDYFSSNWKQVYIVPGNHENYTYGDMSKVFDMDINLRHNVKYINHQKIVIECIEVIFSTLWSEVSHKVKFKINDFKTCVFENEPYTFTHHNELHDRALAWLDTQLSTPSDKKRIVVTHFVPFLKVNGRPFPVTDDSDTTIQYYIARLDDFLDRWHVDYWIYGHNHYNHEVNSNGIQFCTNMLGYTHYNQHVTFDCAKKIEIIS